MVRIRTTLSVAVAAAFLGGCGADNDVLVATMLLPVTVELAGVVTDAPIPNANVMATVAGQMVQTQADSSGRYLLQVSVPDTATDSLVTLEATGATGQEFVVFRSLLGSVGSLAASAGADGRLSADEDIGVNVTHLSTAEAALIAQAGAAPTSDAELETARRALDPERLVNTASAIKLLVDMGETYTLPEGVSNTLAFASDGAAVDEFVAQVQSNEQGQDDFQTAQTQTADDPNVVAQNGAAPVPDRALAISALPPDAFNFTGFVSVFEFEDDGTGRYFNEFHDTSTTWQRNRSRIEVVYDEPVDTRSFEFQDDGSVRSVRFLESGVEIVPLGSREAVQMRFDVRREFPDEPGTASETVQSFVAARFLRDAREGEEFPPVSVMAGESIAAQVYSDRGPDVRLLRHDVLTFSSGGMGTSFLGDDFTWSLGDQALTQVFTDGSEARHRFVRSLDGCASVWLSELTGPAGDPKISSNLAICDQGETFDAASIPGFYYQFGIGEEELPREDRLVGFGLRFDADGTGTEFSDDIELQEDGSEVVVFEDESTAQRNGFFWTLSDPRTIDVTRTFNEQTQTFQCDPVGDPDCNEWDRRSIRLLNVDDRRFYWLETRRTAFPSNADVAPTYLARYYDYREEAAVAEGASKKR